MIIKNIKKGLILTLIFILLMNFIFLNSAYADEDDGGTDYFKGLDTVGPDAITGGDMESAINEGSVTTADGEKKSFGWSTLGSIFGTIAAILASVANLYPNLLQYMMQKITDIDGKFTIEQAVFNEIPIFNINFFDFSDKYTIGTGSYKSDEIAYTNVTKSLKNSIARFFYIVRLIAIMLSLLILIYVGIRLALATISSQKSKYKEMLMYWVESILLIFLMQYIISLVIGVGQTFENVAYSLREILSENGEMSFENDTLDQISKYVLFKSGWEFVAYSVVYWFLVGIQIKYFFSYFRRVIVVGFLIMIAPVVTITYPIDKLGDGKAQAFTVWFSELCVNIFIQPIHAFIYLTFMFAAGEIAKKSIIFALIFLLSLTKVEKMVLHLFNLKNVASLKPVEDEKTKI